MPSPAIGIRQPGLGREVSGDPPMNRGPGILHWNAIYVPVSEEVLRTQVHAITRHSCYERWLPSVSDWVKELTWTTSSNFMVPE